MPSADREHRHEPRGRRGGRPDPGARSAGSGSTGTARSPSSSTGMEEVRDYAERLVAEGSAYRRRGRDPLPDARRGARRLGGRRPRPDRVPEREPDRPRARPLRRAADLQLRLPGRGHARRHHARDPGQRPRLEHADADQHPQRALGADLPVYAHVPDVLGDDGKKLSKRHGASRSTPSGTRATSRGADELPRAPRLELRRQDDGDEPRRARRALLPRAGRASPATFDYAEARLVERRLPARAPDRRLRRGAASPGSASRASTGPRSASGQPAARPGEDRAVLPVPRLRPLPLRAGRARTAPTPISAGPLPTPSRLSSPGRPPRSSRPSAPSRPSSD